jgi:hypothetical protein
VTVYPVPKPARREKKPRKPVKRRNAKRYRANWSRAFGSPERRKFVASLPCVFARDSEPCAGKIENHHTANDGKSRKGNYDTIVPLCTRHHGILHRFGVAGMERSYRVNLKVAAAHTELRWKIAQGISGTELEQQRAKAV